MHFSSLHSNQCKIFCSAILLGVTSSTPNPYRVSDQAQDTQDLEVEANQKYKVVNDSEESREYSSVFSNNVTGTGHARSMSGSQQA